MSVSLPQEHEDTSAGSSGRRDDARATRPRSEIGQRPDRRGPLHLRANLFGVPMGVAGLAQCWTAAATLGLVPYWPGRALWVLTGVLWVVISIAFLRNAIRFRRLGAEASDPTFGPFSSLALLVPTLLAVVVADEVGSAGRVLFLVVAALATGYGAWVTAGWVLGDGSLVQWHPGYLLPTVATGLVSAAGAAHLGFHELAVALFGYGLLCWFSLTSVIWLRLFTLTPLPLPLVPTLAIEVAPPVVAGNAWFAITGGRVDAVVLVLTGYAALMVVVQLRLVSLYRHLTFAAGWWAFAFSYAATFAFAIRWVGAGSGPAWVVDVLLGLVTVAIALLAVRSVMALRAGTFLPRDPTRDPAP